jgi:hypothetical protein
MSSQIPHTPEEFDLLRRYLDSHADEHTWAEEWRNTLREDALNLIARGAQHPEALAQAALGPHALDVRDLRGGE